MSNVPNSSRDGPTPAVATPSPTLQQKPWSWIKGHSLPAILETAKLVAALGVLGTAVIWATSRIPPIGNFVRDHFDSLIVGAINSEIAKGNLPLKESIRTLMIAELNEPSSTIHQQIQQQANALFTSSLSHKIGPMVAGRFTLDSAKPYWKVDVFWRAGHLTRLWVYVDKFENGDCILIQPPDKMGYPITTPGPYHDIDIAKLLTVEPGSMTPSGLPANVFKLNKGMLEAVHQLTFILGTKDNTGKDCKSPRDSKSGSVEVEYFMATAPLVDVDETKGPWGDVSETK